MIVDTPRLFRWLLRVFRVNTICDVGSRDGADALRFRAMLPSARIIAFEPNPSNLALMQSDAAIAQARIEVHTAAVANTDGAAELYVVPADYASADFRRGLSSLYRRPAESEPQTPAPVTVTRLDTFFAQRAADMRLALWIDVEGKAYEVIDGAAGLVDTLHVIHVEVETQPVIAPDQRLYPEVRALLEERGFREIATSRSRHVEQFNAVFVRRHRTWSESISVRTCLALAGLRFQASRVKRWLKG